MADRIQHDHSHDGIDRRGFLKCMAWVGTGVIWTMRGGILSSRAFGAEPAAEVKGDFSFAQISDSHIGFSGRCNSRLTGSMRCRRARIC